MRLNALNVNFCCYLVEHEEFFSPPMGIKVNLCIRFKLSKVVMNSKNVK